MNINYEETRITYVPDVQSLNVNDTTETNTFNILCF